MFNKTRNSEAVGDNIEPTSRLLYVDYEVKPTIAEQAGIIDYVESNYGKVEDARWIVDGKKISSKHYRVYISFPYTMSSVDIDTVRKSLIGLKRG